MSAKEKTPELVTMRARRAGICGVPPDYPRRYRPGAEALRDIRRYQNATERVFPKTPFQRLVREITKEINKDLRMQQSAVDVLQEAAEAYLEEFFKDTKHFADYAKKRVVTDIETTLVELIRARRC